MVYSHGFDSVGIEKTTVFFDGKSVCDPSSQMSVHNTTKTIKTTEQLQTVYTHSL